MANSESFEFLDDIKVANKILSYPQSITVFLGKPGSGKTRFFQRILRKWGNGKTLKKYTLMYFQLDYGSKQDCSWDELAQQVGNSVGNIKATLFSKSILILDGVNISTLESSKSMKNTSPLEALLQNFVRFEEDMKIWIGCRGSKDDSPNLIYDIGPVVYFEEHNKEEVKSMFMEIVSQKRQVSLNDISQKSEICEICQIFDEYTKDDHPDTVFVIPLISVLLALGYLNKGPNDDMKELIKIIFKFCGNNDSDRNIDIDYLMEFGYWDLLACLLEACTKNEEEYTKYVKMFQMRQIEFSHVDDEYLRQAIRHLFQTMKEKEVSSRVNSCSCFFMVTFNF